MEITHIAKKDGILNRKSGKLITKLRVVGYARVSTANEEQLNSYNSQMKYYKEKIQKNAEWTYVGLYSDEAISGTLDYKRNGFMTMINDATNDQFDMIITKSISRFARNTLDTLKYVRLLKSHNVAVLFEEENINTLDMTGELLLTVLSSVAQQDVETISSHVKLGQKMKIQRGELVGFNNCMGYRYDSKTNKLSIVPEEAEIIKLIFKTYLDGYGCGYIAKMLDELNIPTAKRKKHWWDSTVMGILKNEKYVGDALQGKTFTSDPISHRRLKNFGEEDKYYIRDHHEAIIDRKTFEKVQDLIKFRVAGRMTGRTPGGGRSIRFPLSSITKCGFCGDTYGRRNMLFSKGSVPIWECTNKVNNGADKCSDSKAIRESIIYQSFIDGYKFLCSNSNISIDEIISQIKEGAKIKNYEDRINVLKTNKSNLEYKINKLVDLMLDGTLDNETYLKKREKLNNKIDKINYEIEQYIVADGECEKSKNGIKRIESLLNSKKYLEEFDKDVFHALVDCVIIGGRIDGVKDRALIRFICKTNFDRSIFKSLDKNKIKENCDIIKGKSKDYVPLIDFYSPQQYYTFEKDSEGKIRKRLTKEVRVRFEIEISSII